MKIIELYFTIKLLIPVIILTFGILFVLYVLLKSKLYRIFKKNCYECKHYILFDVANVGDSCKYKCNEHNRIDRCGMNTSVHYKKCKEFEVK